ncbi:MAG TPA: threonine--tRNA ligase [bacterium]|nr:threonine--tRNA ligase [bacterium]HPQ66190.1 threonine--tRNA ligase [bacterium]
MSSKQDYLDAYRHSSAHVMAQAVKRLYPQAKLGIGPSIEDGFYYDFDLDDTINPESLERIEDEMKKIAAENHPFERESVGWEEARRIFTDAGEVYKLELLDNLRGEDITIYRDGEFFDLCRGPHVGSTGEIKAFKLLSVAGAYWKGDEQRPMLQRIYGTSFPAEEELAEYLHNLEEARERDHRRVGKEMDLFSFHEEAPGMVFFHPRGVALYEALLSFWRSLHRSRGYREIMTPLILKDELWHRSGHWDHYQDHMYFCPVGDENYAVKPMNCPGGILFYKENQHSYREFPLRIAELGRVHRRELTGVLHGLFRVQSFIIDDAHIYCLPEQIRDEIRATVDLILELYRAVGFEEYQIEVSTRPESSIGSDKDWDLATRSLTEALESMSIDYEVREGEGAFYGPKIDFHIRDCLKRSYQCGTIQLDFSMPERFDLEYIGPDGKKHRPVMIHRAAFGSIERFLGILLEHYGGALPCWLAPVQAVVIPVSRKCREYAREVLSRLEGEGIRAELDDRNEKLGWKIRAAREIRAPYMLIVGAREAETGEVSVRKRNEGELGSFALDEVPDLITQAIREKS